MPKAFPDWWSNRAQLLEDSFPIFAAEEAGGYTELAQASQESKTREQTLARITAKDAKWHQAPAWWKGAMAA